VRGTEERPTGSATVAIILDNSGLEAVCDVCFIDFLLKCPGIHRILVMVKVIRPTDVVCHPSRAFCCSVVGTVAQDEPVFVSDVMEKVMVTAGCMNVFCVCRCSLRCAHRLRRTFTPRCGIWTVCVTRPRLWLIV
jgi:hypothetical protein